jgi:hypothetical protein
MYGGFLDPQIAEDFVYYADTVFRELGHLVQHWITVGGAGRGFAGGVGGGPVRAPGPDGAKPESGGSSYPKNTPQIPQFNEPMSICQLGYGIGE